MKDILIQKINRSNWWHVPPRDFMAYKKRGKFLASTYAQAAFYGKPNLNPERVNIKNPIFGFSEAEILEKLFPGTSKELLKKVDNTNNDHWYQRRISLDAKIYRCAKRMGFDAVILMSKKAKERLKNNKKPVSIELNLLYV